MRLTELIQRFESINLISEAEEVMRDTERTLVGYNQAQMYGWGEDNKGNKLPPYKSDDYARYKHGRNPQPGLGTPDYYLTGTMFSLMKAVIGGGKYSITSDAPYTGELIARGADPFGLQPRVQYSYSKEVLYPRLRRRISQITGLRLKSK